MFTPVSLEQLRSSLSVFAQERQWQQFHTPRNLLLAMVGEVGELSEIFQWRGEVAAHLPDFTQAERQHVGQELSDVLLYLIRLADVCGIDLGKAALDKLAHNAAKYPADKCRGKSDKYTAYTQQNNADIIQQPNNMKQEQEQLVADEPQLQYQQQHNQQESTCGTTGSSVPTAGVGGAIVCPMAAAARSDHASHPHSLLPPPPT